MNKLLIISFYKFINLPDHIALRCKVFANMVQNNLKGTILLAKEGINGSFAGQEKDVRAFCNFLRSDPRFDDLWFKENFATANPFDRIKVKIRQEIVSLGVLNVNAINQTGIHVEPENWNQIIKDEDTIVIDTRNNYEYEKGTFVNAISPNTENFRDFPDFIEDKLKGEKNKKIAMFCTGGIRCEKASSYLIQQGFEKVYQLKGGILNYLATIPKEQSLWDGECFVFDNRVAINASLEPATLTLKGSIVE